MEKVFVNANPSTSEKLIMARTVAFLAAAQFGFIINEYSPNEIKKNITGSGHAGKEQVHTMIQKILGVQIQHDKTQRTQDSIDAIAVALCDAFHVNWPSLHVHITK
jgi:crossover junction endodeoxyribonuclease RuvC